MPTPDHIKDFLQYLSLQKRYSPHTIESYQKDLSDLENYVKAYYPDNSLTDLKLNMLRSWLASLKDSKMESRSINRKISAMRSFYKYLLRQQIISTSPAASISLLKTKKSLPSFVEENQIKQILLRSYFQEGFEGDTEHLIIMLFYTTGMRVSELTGLQDNQIDQANATVTVLGKGNKQRILPLKNEVLQLIRDYVAVKKKVFEKPSPFLVVNQKGNPLSPASVYKIVNRILGPVVTLKKKSPHVLRHTFATHLSDNGAAINAIKDLLGHSSLAATQVYTHTAISKLKEVHKQAHPKA